MLRILLLLFWALWLFIAYALQGGHMRAFVALGVSWLVVRRP